MICFQNTQSLNGLWDFHYEERALSDAEILSAGYAQHETVPGCFDAATSRFTRPGTAVYRKRVVCGGRVMFRVRGVTLRAKVFFEGKLLGSIPYAFTPCDFVVDNVRQGEHDLIIAVTNIIDESNSSMFHEAYDFYSFGGICRPVELRHLNENYIQSIAVTPLHPDSGKIRVKLTLEKPASLPLTLKIDRQAVLVSDIAGDCAEFDCIVPAPVPWSPEQPVLHTIEAELPFDRVSTEFGLRTLSWNDGILKLNGQPLKLYGFCRHDSHPEFGYAMPEALVLKDLQMLKEAGCNFLRGSHYKQSDFLLDCCDRLGILVWEESCGWGNSAAQCADPVFRKLQNEQTRRMVQESINHPSIILWGFMNELDSQTAEARELLSSLFATVRAEDRSRPVTFASNKADQDICYDLADVLTTNLYPGWYPGWGAERVSAHDLDKVLPMLNHIKEFVAQPCFQNKPWIISEIGAAAFVGSHSGCRWSEEYQEELIHLVLQFVASCNRCNGVSIWHFANANTYLGTNGIMWRPNGMNNKGLLTEFRQPKLAWRMLRHFLHNLPCQSDKT